ncbi:MAG: hypothetical protein SFY32_04230 [Bacteroidota bacterium]|nr:hypothetical protein [Bacteroidota bacterium]
MRLIFVIILIYNFSVSFAQSSKEKIEAARINFIKERIELTNNQEAIFWPLYNEYQDKRSDIKRQMKLLKTETGGLSATDEQLKADLERLFELRQLEQELEKDYYRKFLKVISIRQLIELMKAEKQFTIMLVKKLEENK